MTFQQLQSKLEQELKHQENPEECKTYNISWVDFGSGPPDMIDVVFVHDTKEVQIS